MNLEIKLMQHLRHLSSDGNSTIIYDVRSMALFEVDNVTAMILEDAFLSRCSLEELHNRSRVLLDLHGIDSSHVDQSIASIVDLVNKGILTDAPPGSMEISTLPLRIDTILLNISQDCQLGCKYCFASQGTFHDSSLKPLMDVETGRRAVDFLFSVADKSFTKYVLIFFGGEPLMNWPLIEELVAYSNSVAILHGKVMDFRITTNAIEIDEKKADFLAKHNFNIVVSLDGDEEVHNELRPHKNLSINSYQKTVEAISILRSKNIEVAGRATLTSKFINPSLIEKMLFNSGVSRVAHQMISCLPDDPLILNEAQIREYASHIAEQVFNTDVPNTQREILLARLEDGVISHYECGFSNVSMSVDSLGRIYACHRVIAQNDYYVGSVFDKLEYDKIRNIQKRTNINVKLGCRSCWARFLCRGCCPSDNLVMTGSIAIPNSYSCYVRQRLIDAVFEYLLSNRKNTL